MDLSCSLPPGMAIVDQARIAESLGYKRLWVSDSPALYSDPWAALALVAANGPKGLAVAAELGDGVMSVQAPVPGFDWSALLQAGTVLREGETLHSPRVFEAVGPVVASFYHGAYDRPLIDVAGMAPMTFTGTREELVTRAAELEMQGLTEMLYLHCGPDIEGELTRMAGVFHP